jgi:hypothetical protein
MEEALANNGGGGYTTRDVCKACGCVATDVACDCGTPPAKSKLACIDNGGPVKKVALSGIATSPVTTAVGGNSEELAPELANIGGLGGGTTPICPDGQKLSCTLGPPPVCKCVDKPTTTTTTALFAQ